MIANADVIRGGCSMLTVTDRGEGRGGGGGGGGGGKICQNLADVICERSLIANT